MGVMGDEEDWNEGGEGEMETKDRKKNRICCDDILLCRHIFLSTHELCIH